jgi:hypothetical protein
MINSSVDILQAEDHSLALAEFADPRQGVFCFQPHVWNQDHRCAALAQGSAAQ